MRNDHYFRLIISPSDFFYFRDRDHSDFSVEFVNYLKQTAPTGKNSVGRMQIIQNTLYARARSVKRFFHVDSNLIIFLEYGS